MVHAGRLKSVKEVHVPECEDVAPRRCALLDALEKTSVRQARAVVTLCPLANKKGAAFVPTSARRARNLPTIRREALTGYLAASN